MKLSNTFLLLAVIIFVNFKSIAQNKSEDLDIIVKKIDESIINKNEDSVAYYYQKLSPFSLQKKYYKNYVDVTTKVGHFYEGYGSFEKSINIYQNALSVAESFNDFQYSSKVLVDISQAYRIFHDYQKAIDYGKRAIKILEKDTTNNLSYKSAALDITAAAFTENKQADSAVIYQEKVLTFLPKLDSMDIKTTIVNIGYTYMELNELEKARIYTEHGLKLYKRIKSDYALAAIYTNLAMYGRRAKKYNYALKMFDTAIYYTKKSNYLEPYFWIYDERSQVYKALNQNKKAIIDLEKLVEVKDSVFKNQRAKTAQEMEAKYQSVKKGKEIAQQKEELLEKELAIKNRNLYATFLGAALLLLGVISIGYYRRNLFKRKQLQKEIDLKDALSTIKTQNRLQEQRLRISRDLHDNIGSQLTFIISSIDNLKFVSKDANEKLKNKLSNISTFTSDTIFQLRDTIWAMNKSSITIDDIHSRTLSFIEKAKTAKPEIEFTTKFEVDNSKVLTSIQGMNIFRVIQEAINNAIKYADASKISVEASEIENQIQFKISDNGKGFDLSKVSLGNGLSNMEKRMSEINGEVFINSKPSQGTDIQIICNL